MSSKPVDTAIIMVVGPCIDDTDFKSLEESIAYNAAGMDVSLIVEKTDGTSTVTAITLTTGGTSDWTHKDGGYYEVEITAAQNAEEGIAYLRGVCDGVLPFESVARYDIVKANIYDSLIKGTDVLQVDVTQLLGSAWLTPGVAGTPDVNAKLIGATAQTGRDIGASVLLSTGTGAGQLDFTSGIVKSNLTQILAHLLTQTGTQLADGFEHFFDVATPTGTLDSLPAAAPNAAGGLPISAAGGLAMDTLADWIDGGRLDLLLDAIPTTAMRGTDGANTTVPDAAGIAATPAEVATALTDINLDHLVKIAVDTNFATTVHLDSVIGQLADVGTSATFDRTTDSQEGIRNKQTDIETDTAEIGTAGAGLTDLGGMSTGMKAEIESEANDALVAVHLDHLLAVDYDPASKPGVATALLNELVENDGGVSRYTANALEQAPSGGTNPNVLIDTTISGAPSSQTMFVLAAGSDIDDAYKDQAIVLYDASNNDYPSVRKVSDYTGATKTVTLDSAPDFTIIAGDGVKTFVTAPGTTAPTVGQIRAEMEGVGYFLDLIKADTNKLQTDWANGGRLDNLLDAIPTTAMRGTDSATLAATWTDARAGYLDNLSAGAVALASGVDLTSIHGAALTETVNGYLAAAFTKLFDVATPLLVSSEVMRGTDGANTTVPDAAGVAPTTAEIKTAIEAAGSHLALILADTGTDGVLLAATATSAQLIDDMWDEILSGATHNIASSAGRRLREIGAYAIHSGTAQAGNSNSITLAATASAIDGTYNRNLIVLVDNTGVGQTRTIVDYDGASKIAIIDRDWRTSPDATTTYQITPDNTPLVVDQGVAQSGTATTIKLRAYASSTNNIYLCNVVAIIAGTGRGQARLVGSYDGTSKIATICGDDWITTPDATSVYVLMPYGTTCTSCIGTYALGLINTEVKDCLTIDTIADSYATDGNQPTIAQGILAIQQMLQEKSISGTTLTVKKPDGSTVAMTFTLDSATAPTSITRAT